MRFLILVAVSASCTSFEVGEPEIVSEMRAVGLAIPDDDDNGVADIAQIERPCLVDSVEVDIEVRHPFRGDVFAELISPMGTLLILKDPSDSDDSVDLVGTFPTTIMPLQPLSLFDGQEAMGGWVMAVGDFGEGDTGTFVSWTLRLGCI